MFKILENLQYVGPCYMKPTIGQNKVQVQIFPLYIECVQFQPISFLPFYFHLLI